MNVLCANMGLMNVSFASSEVEELGMKDGNADARENPETGRFSAASEILSSPTTKGGVITPERRARTEELDEAMGESGLE